MIIQVFIPREEFCIEKFKVENEIRTELSRSSLPSGIIVSTILTESSKPYIIVYSTNRKDLDLTRQLLSPAANPGDRFPKVIECVHTR